jgi:hypothetical protein
VCDDRLSNLPKLTLNQKNGAKKNPPKSIEWSSRATGGIAEMINNFDIAVGIKSRRILSQAEIFRER